MAMPGPRGLKSREDRTPLTDFRRGAESHRPTRTDLELLVLACSLIFDAVARRRYDLEAFLGDGLAAFLAHAVGAVADPYESFVHFPDLIFQRAQDRHVLLAFEGL